MYFGVTKLQFMHVLYELALTQMPRVGDVLAKSFIQFFGSAQAVFEATEKDLQNVPGIGKYTAQIFLKHKENALHKATNELIWAKDQGISVVHFYENAYPKRLKFCNDAPLVLFYKGKLNLNTTKIVSVVGTRNASNYGKSVCDKLVEDIAVFDDILVVSGLAFGIDISIHQACINSGVATLGVLAHGLDTIYPSVHKQAAQIMCSNGGLLTEFVSGSVPDRENFPKRNRIIAGIADATIVVEAAHKGGALITAEIAHSYSRDVFAFPGRIMDVFSEGCNTLIKYQKAQLITNANDVIEAMNWQYKEGNKNFQKSLFLELSEIEQQVADLLRENELSIDELSFHLKMRQSELALLLLEMEMKGLIKVIPGKKYQWYS